MTTSGVALPDDLIDWIEEVAGGRLTLADRRPGGARKEAWFVDIALPDGSVDELFLRYDRSDPDETADPWTLRREATVYLALQDTEVPVPRVLAVHPSHQAMLSVRLGGENWFSHIAGAEERVRTAQDFIMKLAALHRLDPVNLDLPAFPPPTTVPDAVRHELDELDQVLIRRGGNPDPALAFTLDWLRRNIPVYQEPVVLVQGDTGPGNFMYDAGRVVAIVDWELAHLGDPMDDVAWLSLRATQEPFPDFPARLREYEEWSGHKIDDSRVRYYQVMAEAKLQVMSHRRADAGPDDKAAGGDSDVGNRLIYGIHHRRLWLEALAGAVGLELTPAENPSPRSDAEHDRLYGAVLDQLRDVIVPRLTDPLARVRAKGVARIVKYLEQRNAYGAFYDECELDDLARLLGDRPPSKSVGRVSLAKAAREHKLSDQEYLGYLWRRVARETELARPAMGVLADRHWPDLR
ncbi:MAG: phosphotransferase family protein [Acidimicrobiia bacterium]